MTTEHIDILLGLLRSAGNRGFSLPLAQSRLEQRLAEHGSRDAARLARQTIEYALDNWIVDKTIAEAEDGDESAALGQVWFLRILSPEESTALKELPPIKKALLKILRESTSNGRIGVISESLAIEKLREQGFDVEHVPYIPEKTDSLVKSENGESIVYHHLLSEYELSDGHKAAIDDAFKTVRRKERILEKAAERDAAREERQTARKKKTVKKRNE